ncbi:MAG: hypothetical protein MJ076_05835 [Clostridia bacterium]|nr:hypothetical protein [Clostridia bacterium]
MREKSFTLKNRSGIAIEMAIGYTVVIFALCAILTTVTVSTRIRDRRMSDNSSEYFMLDQAGEYFVKAVEKMGAGNDSLSEAYYNETLEEVTSQQTNVKNIYADNLKNYTDLLTNYKIDVFQRTTDDGNNRFTMKIWDKAEYEGASEPTAVTPKLLVSVERVVHNRNVEYKIINWSNQENKQVKYLDGDTKIDKYSPHWGWLIALLLLMLSVVIICVICLI